VTSLLLTASLVLAQGPSRNVTNAQVETRAATQSVEREIAALAARKDDRWVGYRIAVTGSRRSMDCYERSRIALEPAREVLVLARLEAGLVVRLRTDDRAEGELLPSLTPVWRSAEFQEREIYDLYGIHFDGHPDLRRILMWDEFTDFPMRKDYREPDDYEYEPTPHDDVLEKAKQHYAPRPAQDGAENIAPQT